MVNYQNGKIYTIRCRSDDTLIYVGSTSQTLSQRMTQHRSICKKGKGCSLCKYIVNDDWDDWYIELYEMYPCNQKCELEKREGEVIREIGTINKNIVGRTKKEWREENVEKLKEDNKKYYNDNVDKIKEKDKERYENNAEKIKERTKIYRENNTDKVKETRKKYYDNNIEKIKEKVCCDICGAFSSKNHLVRHQKTKKCTDIASKK